LEEPEGLTAYFEPLSDKKFKIIFILAKQYRFVLCC